MYTVNKHKIDFNRDGDNKKNQIDRIMTLVKGYSA